MILFAFEKYRSTAATVRAGSGASVGDYCVKRFENGELHIHVTSPVSEEHCLILGSIAPPDDGLTSTLLLAHTLRKEKAARVTAILPYLAYARHDKDSPGESLAAAWIGALCRASGIAELIAVDIHSERARSLIPIPIMSISPAAVFAEAIDRLNLKSATLIAPDAGAVGRCQAIRRALGMPTGSVAHFEKYRDEGGIRHSPLVGEAGRQVVLIDDILDTGGTLVSACEQLVAGGVEEIHIMVSHGLFTGERWRRLWELRVKRIVCTDSVPIPPKVSNTVETVSIAPLLLQAVRDLQFEFTSKLIASGRS